jgi:ferrochelatase
VLETAAAVAERGGVPRERWRLAYQSAGAGRTGGEPWLGPDVLEALDAIAREGRSPPPSVLVCPVGFVADHLEVLYDLDVACRERAAALGLPLDRTPSLNDDPRFVAALAALVREAARAAP